MRFPRLPYAILLLLSLPASAKHDASAVSCAQYDEPPPDVQCLAPLDPVTTVQEGASYFAKVSCVGCPTVRWPEDADPNKSTRYWFEVFPNDLLYNITLSPDRRLLLLNDRSILPSLDLYPAPPSPAPRPPRMLVNQVSPNFSQYDLDASIKCKRNGSIIVSRVPLESNDFWWCVRPYRATLLVDYDYSARILSRASGKVQWEVTFDAIGADAPGYISDFMTFNSTEQQMVRIVVDGTETEQDKVEPNPQAGSTPFGSFTEEQEPTYELEIVKVELTDRLYQFAPAKPLSVWQKFLRFFGAYPKDPKGHIIRIDSDWARWGRKGSLRNAWGIFLHDWHWDIVVISIICISATLIALYGLYRLGIFIAEQRRLAQWGGMDEVWRRLREGGAEEDGLLEDSYRDDPDYVPPPRYTDDVQVNKPLPGKPLPEKPLPTVPLIDDI